MDNISGSNAVVMGLLVAVAYGLVETIKVLGKVILARRLNSNGRNGNKPINFNMMLKRIDNEKVDKSICNERHLAMEKNITEIKNSQGKIWTGVDSTNKELSRLSGFVEGLIKE